MANWRGLTEEQLTRFFQEFGVQIRTAALNLGRYHYALGIAHGVRAAIHCGYERIAAVELGVYYGAGLLEMCQVAEWFLNEIGFEIFVYGFDSGTGLPKLNGYMDHPELWHSHAFRMPDPDALRKKLPNFAKLIMGDITDTIVPFEVELEQCRLGFAGFDVDLYSSTKRALQIFKFGPDCYLPAVPRYLTTRIQF